MLEFTIKYIFNDIILSNKITIYNDLAFIVKVVN